ncbi:putative (di)nucleoside polyphosphate hydrolase [Candidatus Kinetoplastibacterium desouzaii TCC079E]|uniref:RNA pyrophosphohydrolase n=1 Tax=Candidatus Kinetoplastidibacterium desouzai TCC079E TaxID=1208919 RepID=M1LN36_9PROT|nr:RNA pyrophosphohydrolase [Candidatus Kinetoplastibacterium desouzaii]AGF47132.1 putative (di)nucleoside polyphosphate hydrolase [Candidatus Kinetoplastibacterium desouzaii TCC079E]
MLDSEGYRSNVGIVIANSKNEIFWGKRSRENSWQLPQGGVKQGETLEEAMYRELHEEVGLKPKHVKIIGRTREWLHYNVPIKFIRKECRNFYKGQKQIWFLLRLIGNDSDFCLCSTSSPEFDAWKWGEYWDSLNMVIEFKRNVYNSALKELSYILF